MLSIRTAIYAKLSIRLSIFVCVLSLHRGRGALCGPEQAPHHRHDAQLCRAEGVEHF